MNIQEIIMQRLQKGENPQSIAMDLASQVKAGKIAISDLPQGKEYDSKTLEQGLMYLNRIFNDLVCLLQLFNRPVEAQKVQDLSQEHRLELLNKFDIIVDGAIEALKSSKLI